MIYVNFDSIPKAQASTSHIHDPIQFYNDYTLNKQVRSLLDTGIKHTRALAALAQIINSTYN